MKYYAHFCTSVLGYDRRVSVILSCNSARLPVFTDHDISMHLDQSLPAFSHEVHEEVEVSKKEYDRLLKKYKKQNLL